MADEDAILKYTQQQINQLFANVSASANEASKHLIKAAQSGIDLANAFNAIYANLSKVSTNMETMASTIKGAGESLEKSIKGLTGETKNEKSFFQELFGSSKDADESVSGWKKAKNIALQVGKSLYKITQELTGFTLNMPAALDSGRNLVHVWDLMSKHGMGFAGSVEEMTRSAGKVLLTPTEFANQLIRSSESLSVFGGSANAGAKDIARLQEVLRNSNAIFPEFKTSFREMLDSLGYNAEETFNTILTMTEDAAWVTKFAKLDALEQARAVGKYVDELDQVTRLTGMQREELMMQKKKLAVDKQYQATMLSMTTDQQTAADKMLTYASTFGEAGQEIVKAAIAGVMPAGEEAQQLLATELGQRLHDIGNQIRIAPEPLKVFENNIGVLTEAAERTRDSLQSLAQVGGLVNVPIVDSFVQLNAAVVRMQQLVAEGGSFDSLFEVIEKEVEESRGKWDVTTADARTQFRESQEYATRALKNLDYVSQALATVKFETAIPQMIDTFKEPVQLLNDALGAVHVGMRNTFGELDKSINTFSKRQEKLMKDWEGVGTNFLNFVQTGLTGLINGLRMTAGNTELRDELIMNERDEIQDMYLGLKENELLNLNPAYSPEELQFKLDQISSEISSMDREELLNKFTNTLEKALKDQESTQKITNSLDELKTATLQALYSLVSKDGKKSIEEVLDDLIAERLREGYAPMRGRGLLLE